jgi:hypothetical protein
MQGSNLSFPPHKCGGQLHFFLQYCKYFIYIICINSEVVFLCTVSKNMKLMPAFVRLFGSPLVRGNITKVSSKVQTRIMI